MRVLNKKRVESVLEAVDDLPSLPRITEQVVETLQREDANFGSIEKALLRDMTLTAKVKWMARRRFADKMNGNSGLLQAVKNLGIESVRGLAVQHALDNQYTSSEHPDFSREAFWEYSLATAVFSEILARDIGWDGRRRTRAFNAGHLHGIGIAIIDQQIHEEFDKILSRSRKQNLPLREAEQQILDLTHEEVGAVFLQRWDFPEEIVRSTRYYYEPPENPETLTLIVHLASGMSKAMEYGYSFGTGMEYLDEEKIESSPLDRVDFNGIMNRDFPERMSQFDPG